MIVVFVATIHRKYIHTCMFCSVTYLGFIQQTLHQERCFVLGRVYKDFRFN